MHVTTCTLAGDVIGLAEGRDDEAARGQLRVAAQALMLALVADVLVDLVAEHDNVAVARQFGQD